MDSIKNNCIWFSKPASLNDPFDCATPYNLIEPSEEDYKALNEAFEAHYRKNMGLSRNIGHMKKSEDFSREKETQVFATIQKHLLGFI